MEGACVCYHGAGCMRDKTVSNIEGKKNVIKEIQPNNAKPSYIYFIHFHRVINSKKLFSQFLETNSNNCVFNKNMRTPPAYFPLI